MGEKIKDLKPIKVGDSSFMIELNEGYSKDEGRLIHVQNTHFRYLIDEPGFYKLSTTILRAKEEKDFFKLANRSFKKTSELPKLVEPNGLDNEIANDFLLLLNENHIDYRLIDISRGLTTIIINPNNRKTFKSLNLDRKNHPYGEVYGYTFLYQMKPFELIKYKDIYIEIYYQLPCLSLTPKTWIPLDKRIQSLVWNTNKETKKIDGISYYIYRLCLAVFKDNGFSERTIKVLNENKNVLDNKEFAECLKLVFFNFYKYLIDLLKEEKYEIILDSYYDYKGY